MHYVHHWFPFPRNSRGKKGNENSHSRCRTLVPETASQPDMAPVTQTTRHVTLIAARLMTDWLLRMLLAAAGLLATEGLNLSRRCSFVWLTPLCKSAANHSKHPTTYATSGISCSNFGTLFHWTVELLHPLTHLRSVLRHFSLIRHNRTVARASVLWRDINWLIDWLITSKQYQPGCRVEVGVSDLKETPTPGSICFIWTSV